MKKSLIGKKNFFNSKIKIVVGLFVVVILSSLFLGIILNIPRLSFIGGTEEGWMEYWGGILGSLFGVLGAYLVMKTQIDTEKKEREKELSPILALGQGDEILIDPNSDEAYKLMIPLINGGQTPVFNIEISVLIPDRLLELISDESTSSSSTPFCIIKNGKETLYIRSTIQTSYISILMPGEKQDIILSSILNHIFIAFFKKSTTAEAFNNFSLKFLINYQDYRSENKKNEYMIKMEFSFIAKDKDGICKNIRCRATALKKTSNKN